MNVSALCGTLVRMTRPISSSAGDSLHQGNGVALYDNSARKGSLASLSSFLTVFTPLSAWPLLWGKWGLLVMCEKLYSSAKCWNSSDEYYGPLSLMTVSGIPCLANSVFNASMMLFEVVDTVIISGYREK